MADPRGRRSPEEIAKSMAIARQVMDKQKKKEGIDNVKSGRVYMLIAAVYYLIFGLLEYAYGYFFDAYFFFGLMGLYVLFAIIYLKNPFVVSIVGLTFFSLVIILLGILNPATIFGGILFFFLKITVLTGLIASMRGAKKYKDELNLVKKKSNSSDILDEAF